MLSLSFGGSSNPVFRSLITDGQIPTPPKKLEEKAGACNTVYAEHAHGELITTGERLQLQVNGRGILRFFYLPGTALASRSSCSRPRKAARGPGACKVQLTGVHRREERSPTSSKETRCKMRGKLLLGWLNSFAHETEDTCQSWSNLIDTLLQWQG